MEPTDNEAPGPAHLLVFARLPELGRVKTRLAATVGPAEALRVYRHLLAITEGAVAAAGIPATVWLAEVSEQQRLGLETNPVQTLAPWAGRHWRVQNAAFDLGGRMAEAFAEAFGAGAGRVAVIGTDCPGLRPGILRQAFEGLQTHDVVIGPAADGGYYLLALRQPRPELFRQIAWSSPAVLTQTLAAAAGLGLRVHLLEVLNDVDTADDLRFLVG